MKKHVINLHKQHEKNDMKYCNIRFKNDMIL